MGLELALPWDPALSRGSAAEVLGGLVRLRCNMRLWPCGSLIRCERHVWHVRAVCASLPHVPTMAVLLLRCLPACSVRCRGHGIGRICLTVHDLNASRDVEAVSRAAVRHLWQAHCPVRWTGHARWAREPQPEHAITSVSGCEWPQTLELMNGCQTSQAQHEHRTVAIQGTAPPTALGL